MSLIKNAFSNFLLKVSNIIFPLLTFPYITRQLNAETLGRVTFLDAIVQYLIVFSFFGIPIYAIRTIAKCGDDEQAKYQTTIELVFIQTIFSLISCTLLIGWQYWILDVKNLDKLIWLACIQILSTSFLIEWYFQAIEKYRFTVVRSVSIKLITTVATFWLIHSPNDYQRYYAITCVGIFINALINFIYFLKLNKHQKLQKARPKKHLAKLLPFFLLNASVSIYTIFDTILLGFLSGSVAVGLYGVSQRLSKLFTGLILSICFVSLSRSSANDHAYADKMLSKNLNFTVFATIPFALICLLMPNQILLVIAGSQYTGAITCIRVLAFLPLVISICNVYGTLYLMPLGNERAITYATLLGVCISLVLNILLTGNMAHNGAAIACISAEFAVMASIIYAAKKNIFAIIERKLTENIALAIIGTVIFWLLAKNYIYGITLLGSSCLVYLGVFAIGHYCFFKSTFISSVLKLKINEQARTHHHI